MRTIKHLILPSATSRANTGITSAVSEPPIQRFSPLIIHLSPTRSAVVASPPAMSEPESGSVKAKHPCQSNAANLGRNSFCWRSSPPSKIVL